MIKQAIILLIASLILAAAANMVSPNKIDFIGKYRELSSGEGPIIPPAADEGDPPFIAVDVAQLEFDFESSIFIDARDPAEFLCGTIPGSINIPFDYLPEENLEQYFDSVLTGYDKDQRMIVFCSGEECDLSLHLARNLQAFGYTDLSIFFGGSREWENFGNEMERSGECEE